MSTFPRFDHIEPMKPQRLQEVEVEIIDDDQYEDDQDSTLQKTPEVLLGELWGLGSGDVLFFPEDWMR